MIKEYKDWLFVQVPQGAINFTVIESHSYFHSPRVEHSIGGIDLPSPGSYQIIGKGDRISELEAALITQERYLPYGNFVKLLRSLEMEPGTTLVLKKNEV